MVILAAAVLALGAPIAEGTTIQNLVRLKGLERNVLVGLGIVVGLNGTGDESKSSYVAARPFAELLRNMGNSVQNLEELVEADSYALVKVTMQIPATGARSGDELKVEVSAMFNASSLAGGELVMSPLRLPLPNGFKLQTMAFARGTIEVMKDNPRRGAIEAGGQMVTDVRTSPVTPDGTMTLVLRPEVAGYPVATLIARTINYEFSLDGSTQIARVEDPSNIRIYLPLAERDDSASFISTLMTIPINSSLIQTEARIIVDRNTGTIVATDDVVIGPVLLSHPGLVITTVEPPPVATEFDPQVEVSRWMTIDNTERRVHNRTRLNDLLTAFKRLNVPVEDQIDILYELHGSGKLIAKIIER